jgi:HEAT repeat protein
MGTVPTPTSQPRTFLSYARPDLQRVQKVYDDLKRRGVDVWFDRIDLLPGKWKPQILRAIRRSRYFLICLSKAALSKTGDDPGFQDTELNEAYNIAIDQDEKSFVIIPLRLEECDRGDNRLSQFQQFDLFVDWEEAVDRLAVHLGGLSLRGGAEARPPSEKESWVHGLQGRVLAFHYAGEAAKAEEAALALAKIIQDPSEDRSARFAAISAIRWARPNAEAMIEPLIRALHEPDIEFQRNAAESMLGLELRGKRAVVDPLVRALSEKGNPQVRFYAAAALGRVGPEAESAIAPLVRALADPDWKIRRISIEALANIGPRAQPALLPLVEVLEDGRNPEWVRSDAAMAIGRIGLNAKPAVDALTSALEDASPRVRDAAQESLGRLRR